MSGGRYVSFADADGASRFDIAVGSRAHLVGFEAIVRRSKLRNFPIHSFHLLLKCMMPSKTAAIRDTQCGFKLFPRPSLPGAGLARASRLSDWKPHGTRNDKSRIETNGCYGETGINGCKSGPMRESTYALESLVGKAIQGRLDFAALLRCTPADGADMPALTRLITPSDARSTQLDLFVESRKCFETWV